MTQKRATVLCAVGVCFLALAIASGVHLLIRIDAEHDRVEAAHRESHDDPDAFLQYYEQQLVEYRVAQRGAWVSGLLFGLAVLFLVLGERGRAAAKQTPPAESG